jgi:dTDP-4-dehydrorhamnose reductase
VRALVSGAGGQLGIELLKTAPPSFEVTGLAHRDLDITDSASVGAAIKHHRPHVVINAAAYTAVDEAEEKPGLAHNVNAVGAGNLARAAERAGARIIQVSTDYVFDGRSREPYRPDSRPNPINVYGASKLAGEREVQRASPGALIVRSSWLYASHGKNFLRTILSALAAGRALRVVGDQIGVPTAARSLAFAIWLCADRPDVRGIHHWVDGDTASWFDFAVAIRKVAVQLGHLEKPAAIGRVTSEQYQTAALRPAYSVLDASRLSASLGLPLHPWWSWLEQILEEPR